MPILIRSMRQLLLLAILLTIILPLELAAQKLYRMEHQNYTLHEDALNGFRSDSTRYMRFEKYHHIVGLDKQNAISIEFELSTEWHDGVIMLHLDGGDAPYSIVVNNKSIARNKDYITPADYQITKHLNTGRNNIELRFEDRNVSPLSSGAYGYKKTIESVVRGIYLYSEPRQRIFDYDIKLHPDSTRKFAWLEVDAVVANGYNYEEEVSIGFDIYHPDGRQLDYVSRKVSIAGGERDTVRFSTCVYNADSVRWSPESPALYQVVLHTKRNGIAESYIPVKVGYADYEMRDGALYNFGRRVELRPFKIGAYDSVEDCAEELFRLKDVGYNTLCVSYPQPIWFYDLCDEMGFYVVEQSSINVPQKAHSRALGGSPSNDPTLLGEYLDRVMTSYCRVKQHPSVIAFSLAAESGNGYNMYKAYEWLKSAESQRAVVYRGAQGEWNSDKLEFLK